jgi:TRAP-type uncharacterized transport system substrate-binding protein
VLIALAVLGCLGLGVAFANRFAGPMPPRRLVMSTGRPGGAYYEFAQQYRRALATQGFTLDIVPGAGSIETLARLIARQADVGFVQGGTAAAVDTSGLTALGSVFYEPLWVFHRRAMGLTSLSGLPSRRVAVGEPGSGTRALALQLLADNGVTPTNATLVDLPSGDTEAAFAAEAIDAALVVASPRAAFVHRLLADPAVELMSERRDLAYRSRHPFLSSVRLGEGAIDMTRNLPREDKTVLATAASLVVRDGIHPDSVRLLLFAADRVHRAPDLAEPAIRFPSEALIELPLNEQALRYLRSGPSWLERRFPFWLAGLLDRTLLVLLPVVTLLFPLFGFVLPMLDRWQRARIGRWYAALRDAEQRCASSSPEVVDTEIARLRAIQRDVGALRETPTLHLGELYHLRTHIDVVLERLQRRRAEVDGDRAASRHVA